MMDCRYYDPYFEDYSVVMFNVDSALGYKRGLWAYTPNILPFWVSDTIGL